MKPNDMGGPLLRAIMSGTDEEIDSELELMSAEEVRNELKPYLSARSEMDTWDWYAAHAMGMVGQMVCHPKAEFKKALDESAIAEQVAAFADAMLAERAKRAGGDV